VITIRKGTTIASKECYVLYILGVHGVASFEERIGFSVARKRRKLRDIVDILEDFGTGWEAAVEWIRRYEYVIGMGRERWRGRKRLLGSEEAKREYERHLAFLRRNE